MRFLLSFVCFVLVASFSKAETHKYSVEEFLHVTFEGRDAVTVYDSLDLPTQQLSEGKGKNFRTNDGSIELSCFNRHYNANEPYACHFIFDFRGLSNQVVQKSEAKGVRLVLTNPETATRLNKALLVPVAVYKSKLIKTLEIDNGEVVITCKEDQLRPGQAPECSVFIKL
ncbi:MAG: hypothetical protein EBQ92_06495 [Proteobacteria bacterium]|nr:hypothetical protein [Pseudomonadota bacterium]